MKQSKKTIPLIFSFVLIISVAGCAVESRFDRKIIPQTTIQKNASDALREVQWQLEAYKYQSNWISNFETERIRVFFKHGTHLHGFSGCNVFSAEYRLTNKLLSVSSIITTRKHCQSRGDIIMHTEANFLANIKEASTYAIDDELLILFDELGKRILVFKKEGII